MGLFVQGLVKTHRLKYRTLPRCLGFEVLAFVHLVEATMLLRYEKSIAFVVLRTRSSVWGLSRLLVMTRLATTRTRLSFLSLDESRLSPTHTKGSLRISFPPRAQRCDICEGSRT
ncbi:hypothetical protein EDD18DRAFT_1849 [Armillaria luteobubalina]|uniref:Uncharacterized protein n=1 Tax=Armillaria luteobubalina TaxID=153913 RepID=A0AA39QNQ4_9AGAR|nr:hypothetical protein EDD18DRAFT_1849 [Armillaria luteobubalina]